MVRRKKLANFLVDVVPIGTYSVTVTASGFKTFVQNNLALQAFTRSESLSGDAIESFGAEIFRGAFNYFN